MTGIYMDYQATTPVDPRVVEALLPYFTQSFGNAASSEHAFGLAAHAAVEVARSRVAQALAAKPAEIVWTSGATESINMAILGAAQAYEDRGRHMITLVTEHPATLDAFEALERHGWEVTVLPVQPNGLLELARLEDALRPDTVLVSVMHAHNEIGVVQDIGAIGALCRASGALFHVDAAQSFGKLPLDVQALGIDLLSISGHKLYAPKGVGALYVRRHDPRVKLAPLLYGGGQEGKRRPGTLNVPGIVGLGEATVLALAERSAESARVATLRDGLLGRLLAELSEVSVNGDRHARLPGNLNLTIACVPARDLLARLPHIAFSSGSACASASLAASDTLLALGLSEDAALCSVRLGLGRFTTAAECEAVGDGLVAAVRELRAASPFWALRLEDLDAP